MKSDMIMEQAIKNIIPIINERCRYARVKLEIENNHGETIYRVNVSDNVHVFSKAGAALNFVNGVALGIKLMS